MTLALNFAEASAGNNKAARMAIIAITTSNSINVKAAVAGLALFSDSEHVWGSPFMVAENLSDGIDDSFLFMILYETFASVVLRHRLQGWVRRRNLEFGFGAPIHPGPTVRQCSNGPTFFG